MAFRTGLLYREKALLHAYLTVAVAAGTFGRLRAGLGASAFAGAAFLKCRDAYACFGAARGFFERDFEVVAQIGTAVDARTLAPATEDVAEDIAERIAKAA